MKRIISPCMPPRLDVLGFKYEFLDVIRAINLKKKSPPRWPEVDVHCVYRYVCKDGQCSLSCIGYTQCILKQRISGYAQDDSTKKTYFIVFSQRVKTKKFLNNVQVLYRSNEKRNNLIIAEASYIHKFKFNINVQGKLFFTVLWAFLA